MRIGRLRAAHSQPYGLRGRDSKRGVAFMGRARDFYRGLGVEVERVMTDNGPGYRSRLFNE